MSITVKLDMATFRAGVRHKLALSKRTEAEILNKAGRDISLRAIKYTPKADKGAVRANLTTNGTLLRILQSPRASDRLPRSLQGFTRGTHTKEAIDAAAARLLALRLRSIGYIKAGWIKAAQAFGGAKSRKVSSKGNAGKSYGIKATVYHLIATGENMATGAPKVGPAALQKSLDEVGRDMLSYAPKQIASHWK